MPFHQFQNATHVMLTGTGQGRTVIWQKPTSGDMYAPYKDPAGNLGLVRFCSEFDYYAAAPGYPQTFNITHAAQGADPGTVYSINGQTTTVYKQINQTTITVVTHNLGYVPRIMAMVNGVQYPSGAPVQVGSGAARRMVTLYADSTKLYIKEQSRPGSNGLPAITVSYYLCLFRPAGPASGAPLYYASPSRVRLGYGNIDTNEKSLREPVSGESTFGIPSASMMDLHNGRFRWVMPDGSAFDVGPTIGAAAYNGAFFGGVPVKQVAI